MSSLVGGHLFQLLRDVLDAMSSLQLRIEDEHLAAIANDMIKLQTVDAHSERVTRVHDLARVMADPAFAEVLRRADEVPLKSNTRWFFSQMERILDIMYMPLPEDLLRVHV